MNPGLRRLCAATVFAGIVTVCASALVVELLQHEGFRTTSWAVATGILTGAAAAGMLRLREIWNPFVPWRDPIKVRTLALGLLAFFPVFAFWISVLIIYDASPFPLHFAWSAAATGLLVRYRLRRKGSGNGPMFDNNTKG